MALEIFLRQQKGGYVCGREVEVARKVRGKEVVEVIYVKESELRHLRIRARRRVRSVPSSLWSLPVLDPSSLVPCSSMSQALGTWYVDG